MVDVLGFDSGLYLVCFLPADIFVVGTVDPSARKWVFVLGRDILEDFDTH